MSHSYPAMLVAENNKMGEYTRQVPPNLRVGYTNFLQRFWLKGLPPFTTYGMGPMADTSRHRLFFCFEHPLRFQMV